jgi:hypothetical protein
MGPSATKHTPNSYFSPADPARLKPRERPLPAPTHPRAPALPLSMCLVGPICRCRFPSRVRPIISMSCGPTSSASLPIHSVPSLSLVAPWSSLVSSVFPTTAVDPRTHARREVRPRHLPTRPSSFLSPTRTCSLFPSSFCPRSLSLALCHRRQSSPVTRTRHGGHPERQEPRQAFSSTVPR